MHQDKHESTYVRLLRGQSVGDSERRTEGPCLEIWGKKR